MKNMMITTVTACLLVSTLASAGTTQVQRQNQNMSLQRTTERNMTQTGYQRASTLSNAQGQTASRQVDVSGDRFDRTKTTTTTRPDGATATRESTVTRSPEDGTRTKTVTGTNVNGGTYSGQSTKTRTENGYVSSSTFTNANGGTTIRDATVVVDQTAQSITKNVEVTNPNGETKSKTIIHTRSGTTAEQE